MNCFTLNEVRRSATHLLNFHHDFPRQSVIGGGAIALSVMSWPILERDPHDQV